MRKVLLDDLDRKLRSQFFGILPGCFRRRVPVVLIRAGRFSPASGISPLMSIVKTRPLSLEPASLAPGILGFAECKAGRFAYILPQAFDPGCRRTEESSLFTAWVHSD
jgi:hypothetical protein